MMVAFVLGEVAAYQMGMTVWFIIAAVLFLFHRKMRPMKQKTLREDAHSREAETCRKRPRETPECAKAHSFLSQQDLVCPLQIILVRDTDVGQGIGNAKRFPFIDAERVVGKNFYLFHI